MEAPMGDKSPKAKQRGQDQKSAAKSKNQNDQAKRQAQAAPPKDKKK
jgi:hypothetical protein